MLPPDWAQYFFGFTVPMIFVFASYCLFILGAISPPRVKTSQENAYVPLVEKSGYEKYDV